MLNPKKIEFGSRETYKLDAMRTAVEKLAHPELGRKTLLVAGTNGKGSVCAYLTALFVKGGYRVGTYTSPHVVDQTERIRINGKPVTESLLRVYERRYSTHLKPLTYFERMTILAFLIFRDQNVDLQILEVGMGGRLDATNISDPDISVITRIDYDHMEVLGNTLTKIAGEKAGIMRASRPCFVGVQVNEVMKAFQLRAKEKGSLLRIVTSKNQPSWVQKVLQSVKSNLGKHQFENSILALSVYAEAQSLWADLRKLKRSDLKVALSSGSLYPARIQILRRRPLWVVDGAHNANSIDAFCEYWRQRPAAQRSFECIFGVMKDKDFAPMLRKILPWVQKFHLPSFYEERELDPKDLKQTVARLAPKLPVKVYPSVRTALKSVRSQKSNLVVLGSLYLAGAFLREFNKGSG